MLTKTIPYTDFNGWQRTETFYFNLTKTELIEMEYTTSGGLTEMIDKLIAAVELPDIIKIFKELILKAYGEKSPDGKRLIKSPEISKAFSETNAYDQLFMELATNAKAASEFINGIIPTPSPEEQEKIKEAIEKKNLIQS